MNWWTLFELEAMLRAAEAAKHRPIPLPPEEPESPPGLRRRLADSLVNLGVLLDAEASRAAAGSIDNAPHLNGSDV
jgi:hypothetical protein